MKRRDTAADQLRRILFLLPAAAHGEGASIREIAETLGTSAKQILRDAVAVEARTFYHPAGSAPEANVMIDSERVTLETPGEFRRPTRLEPREAMALGLGLRSLALERSAEHRERLLSLAETLEQVLLVPKAPPPAEAAASVLAVHGERPGGDAYEQLKRAARERRCCRIHYLKAESTEVEPRVVEPYALLFAERWWYAVAHCRERDDVRVFRIDRVLWVETTDEGFEVPEGFEPSAYAPGGQAFIPEDSVEAVVRYSAGIAGWIKERYPDAETRGDGSVVVRHDVADPRWLVRHVLQYGADAEVLSPADARQAVRQSVERFLAPVAAGDA
jgi:predicted DNA-binding transcriptional regulator YafY